MSGNITSIKSHRDFLSGPALRTRKRVFDLGLAYTAELIDIRDVEAIRG